MCGIVALADLEGFRDVMPDTLQALRALQHRGQLQAGIASWTGHRLGAAMVGSGKVDEALKDAYMTHGKAPVALGAVRYATVGGLDERCAQPMLVKSADLRRQIGLVLNGTINNFRPTAEEPVDTRYIARRLLELSGEMPIREALAELDEEMDGAWNVAFFDEKGDTYAYRNRTGNRPLSRAVWDGKLVIASEDVAMHAIHPSVQAHDVQAGEMVHFRRPSRSVRQLPVIEGDEKFCFFEWIYFANYLSTLRGQNVAEVRERSGALLAAQDANMGFKREDTLVVPIPKSARKSAYQYGLSYNGGEGLPYAEVVGKNGDERLFIGTGANGERDKKTEERFFLRPEFASLVRGKKIVLIEDSLVRGTTIKKAMLIEKLKEAGAAEIHFRLACPPLLHPCVYGIDLPTVGELMARKHSDGSFEPDGTLPIHALDAIAKDLGVNSVRYMPIDAIPAVTGFTRNRLCMACVTGNYPTRGGEEWSRVAEENAETLKPTR